MKTSKLPRYLALPAFLFFLFTACERNPVEIKSPVCAGIIQENEDSWHFYPAIQIVSEETACKVYSGADTLDVNMDGQPDLRFRWYEQIPDINGECCEIPDDTTVLYDCWPTGYIHGDVSVLNGSTVQIAVNDRSWPLALNEGDTIDARYTWTAGTMLTLFSEETFPDNGSSGNWAGNVEYFMAIRIPDADTLYGWILVNSDQTLGISEFYLEK